VLLLEKTKPAKSENPLVPIIKVKRKRITGQDVSKKQKSEAVEGQHNYNNNNSTGGGLGGLLGGYGSDSDSD
jgi:hypothetical protein